MDLTWKIRQLQKYAKLLSIKPHMFSRSLKSITFPCNKMSTNPENKKQKLSASSMLEKHRQTTQDAYQKEMEKVEAVMPRIFDEMEDVLEETITTEVEQNGLTGFNLYHIKTNARFHHFARDQEDRSDKIFIANDIVYKTIVSRMDEHYLQLLNALKERGFEYTFSQTEARDIVELKVVLHEK